MFATRFSASGPAQNGNTFGLQVRNDWATNGLYQTENRERVDKIDADSGTILPATASDRFTDTVAGFYVK